MAKADVSDLPDWWQREKQKRQTRILVFLVLVLALIGYYYWVSHYGVTGHVAGVNFDSSKYIAFIHQDKDGNTDLYAVRTDGSDMRRLTAPDDKSSKQDPCWTVDGKALIYASNRGDSRVTQLFKLGDGEPRQFTYGSGNKFAPVANSDGKTISYISQGAIKTVLLNGNDVQQVLPLPRAGNEGSDDNELAATAEPRGPYLSAGFGSDGIGIAGVQVMSSEENPTNIGNLTPGDQVIRVLPPKSDRAHFLDTGKEVFFAWEPNGNRLATAYSELIITSPDKKTQTLSGIQIYSFDASGKPEKPTHILGMLENTVTPRNIAWSPDGKQMAFECWEVNSETNRELKGIAVLDVSLNAVIRTKADVKSIRYMIPVAPEGKPQRPKWSPDGSRLMFEMVRKDGGHDICIVNSDSTNFMNLTGSLGGDNSQGAWPPLRK